MIESTSHDSRDMVKTTLESGCIPCKLHAEDKLYNCDLLNHTEDLLR